MLKYLAWFACFLWMAFIIDREIIEADPTQLGIRAPAVEAEMKNCTSEDMHLRYECKEQAILSNQRSTFVKAIGLGALIFVPPILVWMLLNRTGRRSATVGGYSERRLPPISKWRVR